MSHYTYIYIQYCYIFHVRKVLFTHVDDVFVMSKIINLHEGNQSRIDLSAPSLRAEVPMNSFLKHELSESLRELAEQKRDKHSRNLSLLLSHRFQRWYSCCEKGRVNIDAPHVGLL